MVSLHSRSLSVSPQHRHTFMPWLNAYSVFSATIWSPLHSSVWISALHIISDTAKIHLLCSLLFGGQNLFYRPLHTFCVYFISAPQLNRWPRVSMINCRGLNEQVTINKLKPGNREFEIVRQRLRGTSRTYKTYKSSVKFYKGFVCVWQLCDRPKQLTQAHTSLLSEQSVRLSEWPSMTHGTLRFCNISALH